MTDRSNRSILSRWTFIALAVATAVFFIIGNQGGPKGNYFIIGVPICLLLLIVLGVIALIRWRSSSPHRHRF